MDFKDIILSNKRTNTTWFHSYEVPRVEKCIETERIWMVVRSWGARSSESFNGCRVSLLRDGKSSKDRWWWWRRNVNIFDATTHLKMVQMVPFILYFTTVKNKYIKFKNYLPCGVIWPHFCVTSCSRLGFVGLCQTLPVGRGDTEGLEGEKRHACSSWFSVASCGLPAPMSIP